MSDRRYIERNTWDYDSFGNVRRYENVREYGQTRSDDSSYRPVSRSDLSWIDAPPAPTPTPAAAWQSDHGRRLGLTPAREPTRHCCHGHAYVLNPGHMIAVPITCTVCYHPEVNAFRLTPVIQAHVVGRRVDTVPPNPFSPLVASLNGGFSIRYHC